jgi:murein DD-endopeptidase MepM/ murein hydrolase activator NlpD
MSSGDASADQAPVAAQAPVVAFPTVSASAELAAVAAVPSSAPGSGPAGASLDSRASAPAPAAPRPVPASELSGYQWPLPNGRITLPFGPSAWGSRVVAGEPFHDGLDLATFCGDRIVAAHSGVVLAAGRRYDTQLGWAGDLTPYLDRLEAKSLWSTLPIVVVVDDGNGYRSIYAHLSKSAVKKGDTVSAGDLLGYEGMTGRASGCHLHYGLFSPSETARFGIDPEVVERMKLPAWQTARIDPMLVLPERRSSRPASPTTTPTVVAPKAPTD